MEQFLRLHPLCLFLKACKSRIFIPLLQILAPVFFVFFSSFSLPSSSPGPLLKNRTANLANYPFLYKYSPPFFSFFIATSSLCTSHSPGVTVYQYFFPVLAPPDCVATLINAYLLVGLQSLFFFLLYFLPLNQAYECNLCFQVALNKIKKRLPQTCL